MKETKVQDPQHTYIYVNQWLNLDTTNNNEIESHTTLSQKDLDFYDQEVNRISYIHNGIDQTVFPHNLSPLLPHENNISVTYEEQNWNRQDHQTYFVNMSPVTKEKTKLSSVPKTSLLREKKVKEEGKANADNDPDENLQYVFDTLSVDVSTEFCDGSRVNFDCNCDLIYFLLQLPRFFVKSLNYKIYSPQIEFVNNIKGTKTK